MASGKRYAEAAQAQAAFNDMPLLAHSDAHSLIEIHLQANGLTNMDSFGKSDPFARLVLVDPSGNNMEIGRTETIQNTLDPRWATGIRADYHFEEQQLIKLEVYDEDNISARASLKNQELQGSCVFTLAELMVAPNCTLTKNLTVDKTSMFGGKCEEKVKVKIPPGSQPGAVIQFKSPNGTTAKLTVGRRMRAGDTVTVRLPLGAPAGSVTLRGEELESNAEFLQLGLCGKGLANKDGFFGRSDPYYELLKAREDGSWVPVYRSIWQKNTLNPSWPLAKRISMQTLCNGDEDRPLRVHVWDMDDDGSHDDMGLAEVTVRQLLALNGVPVAKQRGLPVTETKSSGKTKQSGSLFVESAGIVRYDTFVDYIKSGWKLNMVLAIDFTGSNGNPATPGSLHHRSSVPNQYEQAIMALSDVITQYDDDQLYPAYGFGGRLPSARGPSHCFPLNGRPEAPECHGVDGILEAYAGALTRYGLSGPTIFAQVINAAAEMARNAGPRIDKATQSQREAVGAYTILLILTDGAITDLEATKQAIVAASGLPLSIIIIGVGNADFSSMHALDSDEERLTDQYGARAERDIVQFVSFRDFTQGGSGLGAGPGRLAKETLAELPRQVSAR